MQLKFHRFKFEVIDQLVNGKWVASQMTREYSLRLSVPNMTPIYREAKGCLEGCSYI